MDYTPVPEYLEQKVLTFLKEMMNVDIEVRPISELTDFDGE